MTGAPDPTTGPRTKRQDEAGLDLQRERDVNSALRSVRANCNAWVYTTIDAELRRLRRVVYPGRRFGRHDAPPEPS